MSIEMVESPKPRIIKADTSLQRRVGNGPLDERVVRKCQQVIDTNEVDFGPLAGEYLENLRAAINTIRGNHDATGAIESLTSPVMQLKANAAVFRYTLIGNLANVMLGFLESVRMIDDGVIEIVAAHERTLSVIVAKKITGDGGLNGQMLQEELQNACARYLGRRGAG